MRYSIVLVCLFFGINSVKAQPSAAFTMSGTNGSCKGTNITFTNTSTGATSYWWDYGDGSISTQTSPTYAYTSSGTFIVTLTASDGTLTSVTKKSVYVRELPSAYFNLSTAGSYGDLKPGEMVKPVNFSTGSIYYSWNTGAGLILNQERVSFSYANPGNYALTLTTTNGCGDTSIFTSNVNVIDTVNYTPMASGYVTPLLTCPGTLISFSQYTNTYTAIKWILGDGHVIDNKESFQYAYATKGKYKAALVAYYKNHTDTAYYTITITDTELDKTSIYANINPQVYDYNVGGTRYLTCTGSPFKFSGATQTDIVKHYWKLPGGIVLNKKDTQYTFNTIGDYNLVYQFENTCGVKDSFTYLLSVRIPDSISSSPPTVMVNAGPNGNICAGNKAYFVAYYSQDAQVKWIFHDGTIVQNQMQAIKQYNAVGSYPVKFVIQYGCRIDTILKTVNVTANAESYSDFSVINSYNASTPLCTGDSIYCLADTNSSDTYRSVTIATHNWYMGDGTVYHTPLVQHKYANAGWYSIMHEAINACGQKSVTARTIWMNSNTLPVANFYLPQNNSCVFDSIMVDQFTSKSDSILIFMGDGHHLYINKNNFFPHLWYVYTTPGNYTVKLMAYNKCGVDSAFDHILVSPLPSATILMSDTIIKTGATISINANLTGSTKHVWYYGPNASDTSSANTLVKTFATKGTYNILLRAMNANGCENEDSVKITVSDNAALNELYNSNLHASVYPNPTNGVLNLSVEQVEHDQLLIRMIDLRGKIIYTHQYQNLHQGVFVYDYNIEAIPNGIYFITMSTTQGTRTFKLLKQ